MKTNILIQTLLWSVLITQISYAQKSFSTNPEKEIIVHFNGNVLSHKQQAASGSLAEYAISSSVLRRSLDSARVEAIGKLIPGFKKEDRIVQTRQGKQVTLSDWSNTFLIRIPENGSAKKFIEHLNRIPVVAYAEENGRLESDDVKADEMRNEALFMRLTPNDSHFDRQWWIQNTGSQNQGSGSVDSDVDADAAWNTTTGNSTVKIAIIDSGIDTGHEEFQGKISGDGTDAYGYHGTAVAGIAAAKGNNSAGIAGLAFGSSIVNEDYGSGTAADLANAVQSAITRGAHVLNNSWKYVNSSGDIAYSVTVRRAIRDAYNLDRTIVASMGNQGGSTKQYPASIRDGVITVGATTNEDEKASYSSTGNWIDVTAPGGGMASGESFVEEKHMYSTLPGSNYGYSYPSGFGSAYIRGTSFSAPVVSGIAALILSENPNLYNDDIENLIEISAEDVNGGGFDNDMGYGRVNAYEALKLLQSPYLMSYGSTTGGSIYSQSGGFTMYTYDVNGLGTKVYHVERLEVRKIISFSYMDEPNVWCRGLESVGWTKEEDDGGSKRNFGQGFCEVVPGTLTNTSATLRTYIYHVWKYNYLGQKDEYIGKFPVNESNVEFAYTVHGIPGDPPPTPPFITMDASGMNPKLNWSAVSGVSSYKIYRGTVQGAPNTVNCNSVQNYWNIGSTSSTTYTDGSVMVDPTEHILACYYVTSVNTSGESSPSNKVGTHGMAPLKEVAGENAPEFYALEQNYPNPFNPSTRITYALPEASDVSIKVYNIMGQEVATLVNSNRSTGFHEVNFDAGSLSSGMYIAKIQATGNSGEVFSKELKMQLVK
ncbi:MAG: S8 family serine peptidase [Balneolaceae bacterium]